MNRLLSFRQGRTPCGHRRPRPARLPVVLAAVVVAAAALLPIGTGEPPARAQARATRVPARATATPYTGPTLTPSPTPATPGPAAELFAVRAEDRIGCREEGRAYDSPNLAACLEGYTTDQMTLIEPGTDFVAIPRTAGKFVVPEVAPGADENATAIGAFTFSALVQVDKLDGAPAPVYARVIVDGRTAAPGEIVIADGTLYDNEYHARTFVFRDRLSPGIHTVHVEWRSPAVRARIRDASLLTVVDAPAVHGHRLLTRTSTGTTPVPVGNAAWSPVQSAEGTFHMPADGSVALTFAASLEMTQGDFILLRPVVDNGAVAVEPPEIALAVRSMHEEGRAATFTAPNLAAGAHDVRWEWRASLTDGLAMATARGWTMAVLTGPAATDTTAFAVPHQTGAAQAGNDGAYVPIPGLETKLDIPEGYAEVAVTFSGHVTGRDPAYVAPVVDGVVQEGVEVMVHHPVMHCLDDACSSAEVWDAGARSYTFALKGLPPSETPAKVGLAVRASPYEKSYAEVVDATMTVLRQPWVGPDLAIGANFGAGSTLHEAVIEPGGGTRPMIVIVADVEREDHPVADGSFMDGIDALAFGATRSAKHYYDVVSGGRVEIVRAGPGVLGPYPLSHEAAHYWEGHACDGEGGLVQDDYVSGHAERQAEVLAAADDDFDFAAYDRDLDGVVTSDELAIVVVTPQSNGGGSAADASFKPYCQSPASFYSQDGGPDGTRLKHVLQWYTPSTGDSEDTAVASLNVLNHELGHLLFWLDDAYGATDRFVAGDQLGQPCDIDGADADDVDCQRRVVETVPQMVSLMAASGTSTPHMDGAHKLHLGWVTPETVVASGSYLLEDVRESARVMILPRRDSAHKEYFVLESRFDSDVPNDPRYDYNIVDQGLAIYHVIEPGAGCVTGAWPPSDCDTYTPPTCVAPSIWEEHVANFVRAGLRLVQPDGAHVTTCWLDDDDQRQCDTEYEQTLWGTSSGQSIADVGTLSCPPIVGDPLPADSAPLLRWADGTPSGYELHGIRFEAGAVMAFDVVVKD
ncbi:hypothetical protein DCC79_13140 [bacterium]|nr:MAG: hypothetical protein DCC79_13140 [bacterium]